MSSFTFTPTIPAANNDPADDQGLMLQNNASTSGLIAVDHVGFNTANGGQHLQVTFPGNNVPGAQTGLASTVYTSPGVAKNTTSQLFFRNGDVPYQLSSTRAWALCNASGIVSSQSYNVSNVTRVAAGQYTVTLTANAVNTSNFTVLVSGEMQNTFSSGTIAGYVITGVGTFQLNFRGLTGNFGVDPATFSFEVKQL
jgi:hypothetical protein